MKSYTDIEQSKKLAEILPLETADMGYLWNGTSFCEYPVSNQTIFKRVENIPCWSLAALLNATPQIKIRGSKKIGYIVYYNKNIASNRSFDIIDACYELILKLNESNLL